MNREGLLRSIAETGYNVGFGAKKNFATHDIVQKAPGLVGFVSLTVGVYALMYEPLNSKWIAATLVVLGIVSLYITNYDHNKLAYSKEGERLTALFYRLRDLYRDVQAAADCDDLSEFRDSLEACQEDFFVSSETKQIMFSDWYAHYKFFWQHQIAWIDEQLKFKFLRDKVPLSFTGFVFALLVGACIFVAQICFGLRVC
jgi:hypothetical protein